MWKQRVMNKLPFGSDRYRPKGCEAVRSADWDEDDEPIPERNSNKIGPTYPPNGDHSEIGKGEEKGAGRHDGGDAADLKTRRPAAKLVSDFIQQSWFRKQQSNIEEGLKKRSQNCQSTKGELSRLRHSEEDADDDEPEFGAAAAAAAKSSDKPVGNGKAAGRASDLFPRAKNYNKLL